MEKLNGVLAGVAQWIEHGPAKWLLVWFPVKAHAWIVGQVPSGGVCERQPHTDISPSLLLCLEINK